MLNEYIVGVAHFETYRVLAEDRQQAERIAVLGQGHLLRRSSAPITRAQDVDIPVKGEWIQEGRCQQ